MLARLATCCALALAASGAGAQPLPSAPQQQQPQQQPQPQSSKPAMANPASVNCAKLGGRHMIRSTSRGEVGMCVFKDGRVCDEWALYRDDRCVGAAGAKRVSK
jgi:putative hemolysin